MKTRLHLQRFVFLVFSAFLWMDDACANLDSLVQVNSRQLPDSLRARHEFILGKAWEEQSPDSAKNAFTRSIEFFHRSVSSDRNPVHIRELAKVYLRLGLAFKNTGDIYQAKEEYRKALFLFEYLQSPEGVAECLNNIGLVYYQLGELNRTLEYLYKSLHLLERSGTTKNAAYCYLNIASVQEEMGENEKALESYLACMSMLEELQDPLGLAYVHNNLSYLYCKMKAFQQAIEHAVRSYSYSEKSGDKRSMSYSLANMGTVYQDLGDHDKAIEYFEKGLQLRIEMGDRSGIVYATDNIAEVYRDRGDYTKAIELARKAHADAMELGYPEIISRSSKILYMIYEKKGDYGNAFPFFKTYISMRDSLQSQKNRDDAMRQEMQMTFGKRESELRKEQEAREIIHTEEAKRQQLILVGVIALLTLIAAFAWLFYKRLTLTRLQKQEIERQKLIVDEKNREILDSITYAKRLQNAILPPSEDFTRLLGESFVMYLPKDIVAGDFYFLETCKGKIIFAAADCTGHGVPGALVSVVCANALTRVVKELGETDPGIILDETSRIVEDTFSKNQEKVWDGMDISLCVFDPESQMLQWAGANNPLWIFRKNSVASTELIEIKPDKQPIGKYDSRKPFKTHSLPLLKDDMILLFSDGLADQFGGPSGKKLKYKSIQKAILENSNLPLSALKSKLENDFHQWKGDLEQIDDICLIGVRV